MTDEEPSNKEIGVKIETTKTTTSLSPLLVGRRPLVVVASTSTTTKTTRRRSMNKNSETNDNLDECHVKTITYQSTAAASPTTQPTASESSPLLLHPPHLAVDTTTSTSSSSNNVFHDDHDHDYQQQPDEEAKLAVGGTNIMLPKVRQQQRKQRIMIFFVLLVVLLLSLLMVLSSSSTRTNTSSATTVSTSSSMMMMMMMMNLNPVTPSSVSASSIQSTRTATSNSKSPFKSSASSSPSVNSSSTHIYKDDGPNLHPNNEYYGNFGNGNLIEYSVAHSDRSLNYQSIPFQHVMRHLNELLKTTYGANKIAIIPGSGTFGMESITRQFVSSGNAENPRPPLIISNGHFGQRWYEIIQRGNLLGGNVEPIMIKAIPIKSGTQKQQDLQYRPPCIEDVIDTIQTQRPSVVFATHVETSTGIMLTEEYIKRVSDTVHSINGIFVLDCIASGSYWLNMKQLGIDVLLSSTQKDWTSSPGVAIIGLSQHAIGRLDPTRDTSFSLSLTEWLKVMDSYQEGSTEVYYHATPPTDLLRQFHLVSLEILQFGLDKSKLALIELGTKARHYFDTYKDEGGDVGDGHASVLTSVAAKGFQAPSVLVYYTPRNIVASTHDVDVDGNTIMVKEFQHEGIRIDHGFASFDLCEKQPQQRHNKYHSSFRIGLFGLDKLLDVNKTLSILEVAINDILH